MLHHKEARRYGHQIKSILILTTTLLAIRFMFEFSDTVSHEDVKNQLPTLSDSLPL